MADVRIPILFAAGIDWLEAILPLLFVGFWIVSQVVAVLRKVAGPAAPPRVNRVEGPRVDVRPRQPPPLPENPRDELVKQIAEFLKHGQNDRVRREPQPAQRPAAPPRTAVVEKKTPRDGKPPVPAAAKSPPAQPRVTSAIAAGPSDVARHVQDAFAHDLGHLHSGLESREANAMEQSPAAALATAAGLARDILATARDPIAIRQAVLLREILDRPVDRW